MAYDVGFIMCSYLTAGAGSLEMAGNWKMAACPAFTVTSAAGGGANALISEIKKDIKRVKSSRNKVHRGIIRKHLRGTQIIINSRWYQLDVDILSTPPLKAAAIHCGQEKNAPGCRFQCQILLRCYYQPLAQFGEKAN